MRHFLLIGLMLTCFNQVIIAAVTFEKVEVNSTKAPAFIKPLVMLLADHSKNKTSQEDLLNKLKLLNKNLGRYSKDSTKVFFMSEFFKSFLQLKKNSQLRSTFTEVSLSNLAAAQKKLQENNLIISKMSEFLLVEVLLSYQSLINKKESKSSTELKKVNIYLGAWVGEFLKRSIAEFDALVAEVSKNYLSSTVTLSRIMLLHGSDLETDTSIFNNLETVVLESKVTEASSNETGSSASAILPEVPAETGITKKIDELLEKVDNNQQ